ncbi:MAG: tetratricopeptide repeat protein [Candidatus Cloacimonetes bacterium]|nr:tetratricopeptide repeat protein [Candidatus Cloacimonadota bacterium]
MMKDIAQLKEELKESTDPHQRSALLLELAAEAWKTGDYVSGKTYAEAALELGMNLGEESSQAEALHLIGTFYAYLDDYDAALEYYLRAQHLNHLLGNTRWEAEAYNSMGDIFIQLSNIPKATECFEKSCELNPGYERSVNNLGYLRMLKGELDEAIAYYRKAISIAKGNGNIRSMIISHVNICDVLCKQKNPEAALAEITEASTLLSSGPVDTPKELTCALKLNQALATKLLGEQDQALQLLLDAKNQAEQNQLQNYLLKSHALLAEFYAEKEQWEAAYKSQFEFSKLHGRIISAETIKKASSIQSYYAREKPPSHLHEPLRAFCPSGHFGHPVIRHHARAESTAFRDQDLHRKHSLLAQTRRDHFADELQSGTGSHHGRSEAHRDLSEADPSVLELRKSGRDQALRFGGDHRAIPEPTQSQNLCWRNRACLSNPDCLPPLKPRLRICNRSSSTSWHIA